MRKSRKFISMPIISIEEGQQIGTVKNIVIDPEKKELAALIVEQRGWFKDQKVIPYNKVHSVGGDAITIEKFANAEKQTNLPNIVKLIKDKYELIGAKVVAENGTVLGYVDEFYVDLINGKIITLEITGRFLDGLMQGKATLDTEYIKTIGKEVLIAVDGAENYLKQIEVGLKGTFKNIKETSTSIWDSTIQKTKSVTKTLNQSLEKKKSKKTAETPAAADIINLDASEDYFDDSPVKEDISDGDANEDFSEPEIDEDLSDSKNLFDDKPSTTTLDSDAAYVEAEYTIDHPIENTITTESDSNDHNEKS